MVEVDGLRKLRVSVVMLFKLVIGQSDGKVYTKYDVAFIALLFWVLFILK